MKISFKNFKSFEKKTEVSVKRFNVIIGKNSAGKSTLSEAIKYFSAIYSSTDPFVGRAFNVQNLVTSNPNNPRSEEFYNKWTTQIINNETFFNTPLVINNSTNRNYDATVNIADLGVNSLEPKLLNDSVSFEYQFFNWTPSSLSFIPAKKTGTHMGQYIDFLNPNGEDIPHITQSFSDINKAKVEIDYQLRSHRLQSYSKRLKEEYKLKESDIQARHNKKISKLLNVFDKNQSKINKDYLKKDISIKEIQIYERTSRKIIDQTKALDRRLSDDLSKLKVQFREELKKRRVMYTKKNAELSKKRKEIQRILEGGMTHWRDMAVNNNPVLIPKNITSISGKSKIENLLNDYTKSVYAEISEKDVLPMHGEFYKTRPSSLDELSAYKNNLDFSTSSGKITSFHNNEMNIYTINSNNRFLNGFTTIVSKEKHLDRENAFILYDKNSFMGKKTDKLVDKILEDIFKPLLDSTDKPFTDWYSVNSNPDYHNSNFSDSKYGAIIKECFKYKAGSTKGFKELKNLELLPKLNCTDNGIVRLKSNYARASFVKSEGKSPELKSLSSSKKLYDNFKSILPDDHNIYLKLSNKGFEKVLKQKEEDKSSQRITLNLLSIENVLSPELLFYETLVKTKVKGLGIQQKYISPFVGDIFSTDTLAFSFKRIAKKGLKKEYKNTDAVQEIVKFLEEIGLGDTFKYLHGVGSLENNYNSLRLDTESKYVNAGKDISGLGRLNNMLKLDNPFSELIVLNVYIDLVKRMVKNMMSDNIFYNSDKILSNNKDKIKKAAKKYKVTQKSIIHQAAIIQRHLLSNIITEVEFNIREYLFTNQTRLINSFEFSSLGSTPSMNIVTPKTIFNNKSRFSDKEMIDWLGSSFKEILEEDFFNTNTQFITDHPALNKFVMFINTSIQKIFNKDNSCFSISIQPVYEHERVGKTFLDMFKVKIREGENKKVFTIAETGSGNAALVSMLSQLYPIFKDSSVEIKSKNTNKSRPERSYKNTPIITIKEPENYLHPNLCAGFIDFIFENAFGFQRKGDNVYPIVNAKFIIETHSEVVLRKVQSLMKSLKLSDYESTYFLTAELPDFSVYDPNKNSDESLVSIMYIQKDQHGSKVNDLGLKTNGFLSKDIPPGFFDISANLISDLWKPSKKDKL